MAKQESANMILNDAQKFVLLIATLVSCPSLKSFVVEAQKLIDRDVNENVLNFSLNFFKPIKNQTKNFDSFVLRFNTLIQELHIAAKKHQLFVPMSPLSFSVENCCQNCHAKNFTEHDTTHYCNSCGLLQRFPLAVAWSDVSRVHTAPIYTYDRGVQFKEWILQYQGKNGIDYSLANKLVCPRKISKIEFLNMMKNITKQRANLEQVHSLYYFIFKITPPDLSHVENDLKQDFVLFNKCYEKLSPVHIPHQFLLYQFLNRYKIKTTSDDVLMTNDSIVQHCTPECVEAFRQCGWQLYH